MGNNILDEIKKFTLSDPFNSVTCAVTLSWQMPPHLNPSVPQNDTADRNTFRAVAARQPRLAGFEGSWLELLPTLRRIEASRGRWKWIGGGTIALGWGVGIAILALSDLTDEGPFVLAAAAAIGGSILGAGLWAAPAGDAGSAIKAALFPHLGLAFDEDAEGFPLQAFSDAGILPAYSRETLRDSVRGTIDHGDFVACEATLRTGGKRSRTVFEGLLVRWDARATLTGRTIVVKDHGAVVNFFNGFFKPGGRVETGDEAFECAFEVHGTEPEEALRLVTPGFRANLLEHHRRFGGHPVVAFLEDGSVLMAMQDRRDRFDDPDLGAAFTDPAYLLKLTEEIVDFMAMIDAIESSLRGRDMVGTLDQSSE